MSTIKNEQKHCQHLTPYRLHSISQNFEEAEQLLCSVGGNRRFGTGEKCKSTAAQTRVVCTVKLYQVDISDPIPASGAASSPCTMKRPRCFSAALGSHTTPEGQQPVEGVGLAAALPSREAVQALPPGRSGLQEKQGQQSCTKCCFSNVRLQVQDARAWLFNSVWCSQDKARS